MAKASLAQGIEVLQMIERGEYDREMVQAIIGRRIMIKPSDAGVHLPPHHFRIKVESTATPSYADLKPAYDWVSDLWDESQHKLELHESLRELTPPTGEVTVFLKKFDRPTTSEKAIKWADEHNYRLVFPWEREAFSKANPDLQRNFWIVDLGSFALGGDYRCVPILSEDDGGRHLGSDWFDDEWGASDRFLFAGK